MRASIYLFTVATLVLAALTGGASAENTPPPPPNKRNCQNTVPFDRWIVDFKREAIADGIREETIREAIGGMTPDPGVIARDRKQGFFSQTFTEFYFKLATKNREQTGRAYLQKYRPIFDRAEKEFGVPGPVITAFWALESDFGAGSPRRASEASAARGGCPCRRRNRFRAPRRR